jgi:hypothetical protein
MQMRLLSKFDLVFKLASWLLSRLTGIGVGEMAAAEKRVRYVEDAIRQADEYRALYKGMFRLSRQRYTWKFKNVGGKSREENPPPSGATRSGTARAYRYHSCPRQLLANINLDRLSTVGAVPRLRVLEAFGRSGRR